MADVRRQDLHLPAWMAEHLESIQPGLMWEFGPGLKGGHRLVITCEGAYHLRPLVEVILARAPVLPGWEFWGRASAPGSCPAPRTPRAGAHPPH